MIPKKIHFIWIGNTSIKEEYSNYIYNFKKIYYDFEIKIWNDYDIIKEDIVPYNLKVYYDDTTLSTAFKVDILRYLIVYKYGGLYFDVDFECLKKLPHHFLNFNFLGGIQNNGEIAIGFFGTNQYNEILKKVIDSIESNILYHMLMNQYKNECIYKITGPEFFNNICKKYFSEQNYFFFTKEYFYPYWFTETDRRKENFSETSPLAYAVHHWEKSWI